MPLVVAREVTWVVSEPGADDTAEARAAWGVDYKANVTSLQNFLCDYFSGDDGCSVRFGKTISPVGCDEHGGKILKVRWMLPGGGKSGGWRFAFVAYCDIKKVVLCRGFARKEDPTDGEFEEAATLAADYYENDEDG